MQDLPPAKKRSTRPRTSFCTSFGGATFSSVRREQRYARRSPDSCECCPSWEWCDPGVRFVDTHCHLEALDSCWALPVNGGRVGFAGWWERSRDDAVGVVRHVLDRQPGAVAAVISNCCDALDFAWYEGLMAAWDSGEFQDERLYWSVGVHPYGAADFEKRLCEEPELEQRMLSLASHPRCVAVGECGLDYCKAFESHEAQKRVFAKICHLAIRLKKPLVVHARDAANDTLEVLRANVPEDWPIHLHGYTGEARHVEELFRLFSSLCVGFCGAITIADFHASCNDCAPLWLPGCRSCGGKSEWVKRDLDALVDAVPLDRLLLETDAPYMSPVQFGWRPSCQPWMVTGVAEHLGAKKGISTEEVILASNQNAKRLYGLDVS